MHPLALGITTYTTESMVVPLFVMVCGGILPIPLELNPLKLPLFEAVQLKTVPEVVDVNVTDVLVEALQRVCGVKGFTLGNGFTVIVSLTNGPTHPAAVGVML